MKIFGSGSAGSSLSVAPIAHPSAPIPVQGPGVGTDVRVPLGDDGPAVFPLILGGAEFGWIVDIDTAHSILDAYLDAGGNAIHTADSFTAGRSEHIIGQWMHSRAVRDDIVVSVRVGHHPDHPGLGPVNLVRSVEASLNRLRTDHIDLLYLDGTAELPSLEEALATAAWLVETGKVRRLGAFGFRAEQLVEARILAAAGYPHITVLDVPYNVLRRRDLDGDLRLVAGAQGLALTPSHPLEHGFLAGGVRRRVRATSVRSTQLIAGLTKRGARTLRALDAIGAELGVPNAAVAVAWLLSQRIVAAPIVNAYAVAHVTELVQGVGVRLTRGQLADIGRASE